MLYLSGAVSTLRHTRVAYTKVRLLGGCMPTKLRVIKGKMPTKGSCVDWSDEKFLQFAKFVNFWVEDGKFTVSQEKRKTCEFMARGDDWPFWDEFMARIDMPTSLKDNNLKRFQMRLITLSRIPLAWIKDNPHALTEELRKELEVSQRTSWALEAIVDKKTLMGNTTPGMNNDETTNKGTDNQFPQVTNPTSPEAQYASGIKRMASMFRELVDSVNRREFKHLPMDKKLRAIDAFAKTLEKVTSGKRPTSLVFKQLNINKAGRDDLEKAILEYSQDQ